MRLYRILLNLYPASFVKRYREPMEQLFRDQSRELSGFQLWGEMLRDLGGSLPQAHLDELRSSGMKHLLTPFTYLLCIAATLFIGRVELRSDDTGVIVGLVLISTAVLGFLHPKRAWLWIITALAVPAAEMLYGKNPDFSAPEGLLLITTFVSTIGLAGSYAGAFLRKTVTMREA